MLHKINDVVHPVTGVTGKKGKIFFRKFQGNGSKCGSIVLTFKLSVFIGQLFFFLFFLLVCMLKKIVFLWGYFLKRKKK